MRIADFHALFDLWRAGDAAAAARYFTDDGIFHEANQAPIAGREAIIAHWDAYFRGGPEWKMTVDDVFGADDRFAVAYTWAVKTADAGWLGRPGAALVHLRDGHIALWREYKG